MATLVLTAVGTAVGGPIGGAIGALLGQGIDARIFRPAGREGARLSDLQVQTSRYGARIPRIYGTLRVAGTVIWSTDLQESSETDGGGKGQPSVTSYSYSASFAVALSARQAGDVGRIWADGNLLRGTAGDFKSPVGAFRFYPGSEDQPVDPLIAAAVGIDQVPACRGCAYAVFEDLQLADFGNRIPSLTFELRADALAPDFSDILSDLAGSPVEITGADDAPRLSGFAAEGDSLREASAAIVAVHGLQWHERGGRLGLTSGVPADVALETGQALRSVDGESVPEMRTSRAPIETVPVRLSIRHHDPARDYQVGIQAAERPGPGTDVTELDYPAALPATDAQDFAGRALRRAMRRRTTIQWPAGWSALALGIGDVVSVVGTPGLWLVERRDWEDMAVRLTLRAWTLASRSGGGGGDPGNPVLEPDLVQGATQLAIVEMPPDGITLSTTPIVRVAATGTDAGWRRAALLRYRPEADAAESVGPTAPRAVIGIAQTVLGTGAAWRLDRQSHVEIALVNADDALIAVSDDQLLAGANRAMLGEEMLQFGAAERIGPARYRLSRFVRGWHGTEWACAGHAVGEPFVLIEDTRLASVAIDPGDPGTVLDIRAIGPGDPVPAGATRLIDGRAMLPPSPVHGRATTLPGGDLSLRWQRRSRLGWTWPDGGDAPLGEEQERYVLNALAGGAVLRTWEVTTNAALYGAEALAADRALAGDLPLIVEVRQQGTWGRGRPLQLPIA